MQVTFLALYHLLDLGSGFDALLRASSAKRGWKETMQYGCFGLALAAKRWVLRHAGYRHVCVQLCVEFVLRRCSTAASGCRWQQRGGCEHLCVE
jgi:hypothetical protein